MKNAIMLILILSFTGLNAQSKKEEHDAKKHARLVKRHYAWNQCFVIRLNGDTIFGRIEAKQDYNSKMAGITFYDGIKFAYADETEEVLHPADMKELYLYNEKPEYRHYVGLGVSAGLEDARNLLRVAIEGRCMLLVGQYEVDNTSPLIGGAGKVGYTSTPSQASTNTTYVGSRGVVKEYFFSYGGKTIKVRIEGSINAINFKKRCGEILVDCPAVLAKIEDKTLRSEDFRQIVTEYNNCIPPLQSKTMIK